MREVPLSSEGERPSVLRNMVEKALALASPLVGRIPDRMHARVYLALLALVLAVMVLV